MGSISLGNNFLLPHITCRASVCYLVIYFFQEHVATVIANNTGNGVHSFSMTIVPTIGMKIATVGVFDLTFVRNMIIATSISITNSNGQSPTNARAIQFVNPESTNAKDNANPPPSMNHSANVTLCENISMSVAV